MCYKCILLIFFSYALSFKDGANVVIDTPISLSAPGDTRFSIALAFSVRGIAAKQILFDSGNGIQIILEPTGGVDPMEARISFILPNNEAISVETCVGRMSLFFFTLYQVVDSTSLTSELNAAIYKNGQIVGSQGLPVNDFNDIAIAESTLTIGSDNSGSNPFNGKLSLAYVIKENVDVTTAAAYYDVFRKNQLAPVLGAENCGDNTKQPDEECDGTAGCTCACMASCSPINTSELSSKYSWAFPNGADDFFPSAEVSIQCSDSTVAVTGFDASGVAVCESGAWTYPTVKCETPCGAIGVYLNTYYSTRGVTSSDNSTTILPANVTAGTHVVCDDGFTSTDGRSYETLACSSGQWSQVTLDCRESCEAFEPRNPTAYKYSATNGTAPGNEFKHGETTTISCSPGASSNSLDITSETLTCIRGQWTPNTLICEPNCPVFPSLGPGYKFADSTIISPSNQAGTTVDIRCDTLSGYYPTQPDLAANYTDSVSCREGLWTAQTLLCKRGCEIYTIVAGSNLNDPVLLPDDQTGEIVTRDANTVPYGSKVSLSCADGFASSNGKRTETLACIGAWPDRSLKCLSLCSNSFDLPDGLLLTDNGNNTVTEGSIRKVACDESTSSLSGQTEEVLFCNNGLWTSPTLSCEADCPSDALSGVELDEATVDLIVDLGADQFASLLQKRKINRLGRAAHRHSRAQSSFLQLKQSSNTTDEDLTAAAQNATAAAQEVTAAAQNLTSTDLEALSLSANSTTQAVVRSLQSIGARRQLRCKDNYADRDGRTSEYLTCTKSQWTLPTLRCELVCPDFPDLESSYSVTSDGNNYRGSVRRVQCAAGYKNIANNGIQTEEIVCGGGGEWGGVSLDCREDCDPEGIPAHIAILSGGDSVSHGTTRELVCAEYKNDTDAAHTSTTCVDGLWTPFELNCGGDCAAVDLKSGRFVVSNDDDYCLKVGCTAALKCDDEKFETVTAGSQSCSSDGTWTGTVPQCQAKCGSFPTLGASYVVEEVTIGVVQVTCASGYIQDPPDASDGILATCSDGGSTPGQWNFKLDSIKCLPPCGAYSPRTNEIIIASPANSTLVNGDSILVGCQFDTSINSNVTCIAGEWSDSALTCRQGCSAGTFASSLSEWVDESFNLRANYKMESNLQSGVIPSILTGSSNDGDSAILSCNDSYLSTATRSAQEIRCSDGIITRPTLRCQSQCPTTSPLQCTTSDSCRYVTDGTSVRPGTTRKIHCADGYISITGESIEEIACDNGNWTLPTIKCEKTCGAFTTNASSNTKAATVTTDNLGLQVVTVSCLDGYTSPLGATASEEVLTCSHGQWQTQTLICEANCKSAPTLQASWNIEVLGSAKGVVAGSNVTVVCTGAASITDTTSSYASSFNSKYEVLFCRNGQWSSPTLRCSDACLESDLVSSLTAYVAVYPGLSLPEINILSRLNANVTCPEGTDAIRGESPESLVCQDGNWSGVELECAGRCPALSSDSSNLTLATLANIDAVNYLITEGADVEAMHGDSAVVSCASGMYPAEGMTDTSERIFCFRGEWTKPALICAPQCPEIVSNQYLIIGSGDKQRLHGAVRQLKCASGTRAIQGAVADSTSDSTQTLRCNNGNWEGDVLECRTNCKSDMLHGSSIEDKCPTGTSSATGINAGLITCLDGKITDSSVDCLTNCPVFDLSTNANGFALVNATETASTSQGSIVRITCPTGYTARKSAVQNNGIQALRCWNGNWTEPVLECSKTCSTDPTDIDNNAQVAVDDSRTFASVTCNPGYVPQNINALDKENGPTIVRCANGSWSPSFLRCVRAVLTVQPSSLRTLWSPQSDQPTSLTGRLDSEFTVYRPSVVYSSTNVAYYPTGDYLVVSGETPVDVSSMAPLVAGNVLRPLSYDLVWAAAAKVPTSLMANVKDLAPTDLTTYISANGDEVSIWKPIAPPGFKCLGYVASRGAHAPSRDAIRCVPDKCAIKAVGSADGVSLSLSSSGFSAWRHASSLFLAVSSDGVTTATKGTAYTLDQNCLNV